MKFHESSRPTLEIFEIDPRRPIRGHLHRNWHLYISGLFILAALLAFMFSGSVLWGR